MLYNLIVESQGHCVRETEEHSSVRGAVASALGILEGMGSEMLEINIDIDGETILVCDNS